MKAPVSALIFGSKLPKAKEFKRWVTSEVLPTIRKTGGYGFDIKKLVNEITTDVINEAIPIVTAEVIKAVVPVITEIIEKNKQPDNVVCCQPKSFSQIFIRPAQMLKIENFPEDFRNELDDLLYQMKEVEAINYSAVSRFCYAKGFPVSNVAIKKYFVKYFGN